MQHTLSVLRDAPEMLAVCDKYDLASVNRGPLGMGLLTGKYTAGSTLPRDDVRGWPRAGWSGSAVVGRRRSGCAGSARSVRALTADGRTLAQGALGWIWARSGRTIPIPGCRTVAQVEENAAALHRGPLPPDQFAEVERQLAALRTAALRDADRPHWPRSTHPTVHPERHRPPLHPPLPGATSRIGAPLTCHFCRTTPTRHAGRGEAHDRCDQEQGQSAGTGRVGPGRGSGECSLRIWSARWAGIGSWRAKWRRKVPVPAVIERSSTA